MPISQPLAIVPQISVVKGFTYFGTFGTTGTFGATGKSTAVLPDIAVNDLRVDVIVGALPACSAAHEACKIQLTCLPSNLGNYSYNQVLSLQGHGVTGGNLMVVKGADANSVVSAVFSPEETGLTGANFTSYLQTVITAGDTGPSQIAVVLTPVAKGSYNLPQ